MHQWKGLTKASCRRLAGAASKVKKTPPDIANRLGTACRDQLELSVAARHSRDGDGHSRTGQRLTRER